MSWIREKLNVPVLVGIIATGLVLLFGYWLAGFEHYDEDWVLRSNWEHFKAAAPNEIGDTLAGFAGALAFVWIIVTVWLQSKELAAQREELRLTREQAEENTLLFQKELELITQREAGIQLDELLEALSNLTLARDVYWRFNLDMPSPNGDQHEQVNFVLPTPTSDKREYFSELFSCMRYVSVSLEDAQQHGVLTNPWSAEHYRPDVMLHYLREAVNLKQRLSPAKQAILEAYKIEETAEIVEKIFSGPWWVECGVSCE